MLIYTEPSNVCMVAHIPAHDIHHSKRMKRMAHHTRVGYSDIACGTQPNALGLINIQRVDLFAAQTLCTASSWHLHGGLRQHQFTQYTKCIMYTMQNALVVQ